MVAIGYANSARGTPDKGLERLRRLVETLAHDAEGRAVEDGGGATTALSADVRAQLHGTLAGLSFMVGRFNDALATAQRAVDVARTAEDDGLVARELLPLGVAQLTVGQIPEAVETMKRAIALSRAIGDHEMLADALRMASWVYQTQGAFKQGLEVQAEVLPLARRLKDQVALGYTLFLDAVLAFYSGDWVRARASGEEAMTTFRALDMIQLTSYAPFGLGLLCLVEGRREEAVRYLEAAAAIAKQSGGDQVLRLIEALWAECELLEGDAAAAHARLAPLFEEGDLQARTRIELSVLRGWAAIQLGVEAETATYVADSVESAREQQMHLLLPDALRVQALWEMRRRNWEAAEAALEEALFLCRTMPYPYAEAKALYVYGQLHAARDEPERARARLEEALAICGRLGERLYAGHVEAALAQLA
jgi:tetratricopeptide (TPR) repeat protein